jgi:hypothetical protein
MHDTLQVVNCSLHVDEVNSDVAPFGHDGQQKKKLNEKEKERI